MFNFFRRRKSGFLISSIGFSAILSSAPIYFFPILFVVIPFFYQKLLKAKGFKNTFLIGMTFGFGYYFGLFHWISFSILEDEKFIFLLPFSLIIVPLYFSLFLAFASAIWYLIQKKISNEIMKILAFAILWILHEKLRGKLFIPFPWWQIGMSLSGINEWIQAISIIDIYFFSFCTILLYLLPSIAISKSKGSHKLLSFLFVLISHLIFILYGYSKIENAEKLNFPFSVSLIQSNQIHFKNDREAIKAIDYYYNSTKDIMLKNKKKKNLILWPETSIPYLIPSDLSEDTDINEYLKRIQNLLGKNDKIAFGGINLNYQKKRKRYTNSIFLLGKEKIEYKYDKINLVPFGEYVPILHYLDWFQNSSISGLFPSNFAQGNKRAIWNIDGIKVTPLICYEILFDKEIKKLHPDIIINLSNDGWFGNTIGPHQHLAHARISAIRNKIPVLRVANTGISAIIDKNGTILKQIERNEDNVLVYY